MIDHGHLEEEMAIGFLMELAKHPDNLNHFSNLSRPEQLQIAEGAKEMHTKDAMRNYVEQI